MTEIKSIIIVEMMGRPARHLKQAMENYIKQLGSEKGIKVVGSKLHEPKKIKNKDKEGRTIKIPEEKEVYTNFAEVELEAKDIFDIIRIMFVYMPAHVEIVSPDEFKMENFNLSAVLNEITKKLHEYDAIAKQAILQNQMLAKRLMETQQIMPGGDKKSSKKKKTSRK